VRGLGAVLLAFGSAMYLRAGAGSAWIGLTGAVLFGLFGVYALRQLLRRGPRLVLGPDGFDAADWGIGPVPWSEVENVQWFGSREAPFMAFHVRDPGPHIARMPWWPRLVLRLHRASGLPSFSVNLIGVDRDPGDVITCANRWLRRRPRGVGRVPP
jgi:hypothetical protein